MNELQKRLASGIVYVLLVVGSVLTDKYIFITTFAILGLICINEFLRITSLSLKNLYRLIFLILTCTPYLIKIPQNTLLICSTITVVYNIYLIVNLFWSNVSIPNKISHYIHPITYISLGFSFTILLPFYRGVSSYNQYIILGVLIFIWVNDSFAYITGKNFGKHKLYESISPKKTIEGFLGGFVATLITAVIFGKVTDENFPINQWVIIGGITSVIGTIGDLIQSKFKRKANVKDSGTIMPGHGGIYDRLDSLLFSGPFIYLYLQFITYVS